MFSEADPPLERARELDGNQRLPRTLASPMLPQLMGRGYRSAGERWKVDCEDCAAAVAFVN
jgi:hypothetical protein